MMIYIRSADGFAIGVKIKLMPSLGLGTDTVIISNMRFGSNFFLSREVEEREVN